MQALLVAGTGLALALLCAGCARTDVDGQPAALLSQVPMESAIFATDYQRLASCAYQRLDKSVGAGLKKVDLPNERMSRLALEPNGVRQWELIFEAFDANHTRVRFSKAQTIWGPLGGSEAMPAVRACAEAPIAGAS